MRFRRRSVILDVIRLANHGLRGVQKIRKPTFNTRTLLIITFLVCVLLGLPSLITTVGRSITIRRATNEANHVWNSNAAFVYRDDVISLPNFIIIYNYDLQTGLPIRRPTPHHNQLYIEAFNDNIESLIAINGSPPYSVKSLIPHPQQLDAELTATDYTPVDSFPFDINDFITLKFDRYLHIDAHPNGTTKKGQLSGIDYGKLPVEYKTMGELVFIRYGKKWIGVFHRDGWPIADGGQ